ncbi:tRNA (adenosine(37)-N6)-dimethylallyltransferase MiaA [Tepidibacillus sp. LV47]|uniref:tRNA (adenosine(37)-N6)-dimethylallyltransferase MiaA n=1 Tax=Tepidibacillus sp. LV47 TaxID=3398228 RepID=UPI003AAC60F4
MKEKLLVIVGPTAVGKTELSIEIAIRFQGEIISGDSMQVYKGMDIGTAKIRPEEMKGIPHYFIDEYEPDYFFTVAEFQQRAIQKITEINQRGHLPIIVGGTGLYIKSVTHHYRFSKDSMNKTYRHQLQEWLKIHGKEALHKRLEEVDPESAKKLHVNDTKRVIRALEVYHTTGKTMSEILKEQQIQTPYHLLMIGLTMDRKKLYDRINRRVDLMVQQGLVEEVQRLLKKGYDETLNSMQGIGYKEIILYLKGKVTLEEAIEMIKQATRRFAKRQLSWFRNMPGIHWFDLTNNTLEEKEKITQKISEWLAGKNLLRKE